MNKIDAWVIDVYGVYQNYDKYWVRVSYTDMGGTGKTILMFNSLQEALLVGPGYKFLH